MRRLLVLLLAVPALAQAQTFTALPVLEIPAQPALGGAGVARTDADPLLALQNPALLGLAQPSRFAAAGAPRATWFGESSFEARALSGGVAAGPATLGVGLSEGALQAEARLLGDGTPYAPVDRFRALTVAASAGGPVRLAAGVTGRHVTSTDAPVWTSPHYAVGRLRGVTMDLGAAASADVTALLGRPAVGAVQPALDVSAGYAQTNLGGTLRYSGTDAQPLPRTAALGWSARAGLGHRSVRLVEAEVAVQAERSLVRQRPGDPAAYASLANGLAVSDAVLGTGGEATTGRRGWRLTLAETVSVSQGRFDGWGYVDVRTRGVEVRTGRLLKTLAPALGGLDLRLGRTTVFAGTPNATTRTSLSLVVSR